MMFLLLACGQEPVVPDYLDCEDGEPVCMNADLVEPYNPDRSTDPWEPWVCTWDCALVGDDATLVSLSVVFRAEPVCGEAESIDEARGRGEPNPETRSEAAPNCGGAP